MDGLTRLQVLEKLLNKDPNQLERFVNVWGLISKCRWDLQSFAVYTLELELQFNSPRFIPGKYCQVF